MRWAIFCQVIDNFGDIGVSWRLACNLAARGQQVRLFVDDPSALRWMAPEGAASVEVIAWSLQTSLPAHYLLPERLDDVLVEAFACTPPTQYLEAYALHCGRQGHRGHWINLEYLSAQAYVQRSHGLPSPVQHGPGASLAKHFFYPGFQPGTGGLLREPGLLERRQHFQRAHWLADRGLEWRGERLISLFCYEPWALAELLQTLQRDARPTLLLVCAGRAQAAVRQVLARQRDGRPSSASSLRIHELPYLSQNDYDCLLWSCDLNFVRGEDSLVRALWAQQAFVWQAYTQDDDVHHDKLNAFLDWLQADVAWRALHQRWNATAAATGSGTSDMGKLLQEIEHWQANVVQAVGRLRRQKDLASALLDFVGAPLANDD